MASVNKVILLGHLGKDPEVRAFPNGGKVVSFSLATSESWTDKATGEKRERTEWHNVQITYDGLAGVAERFLRKGSKAYVEGQLRTRKWQDRDGNDRWTTEVVLAPFAGELVLLDPPRGEGRGGSAAPGGPAGTGVAMGFQPSAVWLRR